jgi:hypothetical protein
MYILHVLIPCVDLFPHVAEADKNAPCAVKLENLHIFACKFDAIHFHVFAALLTDKVASFLFSLSAVEC